MVILRRTLLPYDQNEMEKKHLDGFSSSTFISGRYDLQNVMYIIMRICVTGVIYNSPTLWTVFI